MLEVVVMMTVTLTKGLVLIKCVYFFALYNIRIHVHQWHFSSKIILVLVFCIVLGNHFSSYVALVFFQNIFILVFVQFRCNHFYFI